MTDVNEISDKAQKWINTGWQKAALALSVAAISVLIDIRDALLKRYKP